MPRLAICFEFATLSGGERSMLAMLDAPPPPGWDVVLLLPPHGRLFEAAASQGLAVHGWDLREEGTKPPPEWAAESLRKALGEVAADHVHANSLSLARTTGRLARSPGAPTATGHLRDMMRLSAAARRDLAANAALVAVSPAVRDYHVAEGLPADRVVVVPNGIAPFEQTRPPGWLRRELGLPADRPIVATIGQIGLRKGHDTAAAAIRRLAERGRPITWLVVGERFSQKAESVAFDEALDAASGGAIVRSGYRDDVLELLAEVDLLLHPARQEPLGRVLLEAREVSTPIVACDVGGNRFAVPDAAFVPPDAPVAMAEAIDAALAAQSRGSARESASRARGAHRSRGSEAFPLETVREQTWNLIIAGYAAGPQAADSPP